MKIVDQSMLMVGGAAAVAALPIGALVSDGVLSPMSMGLSLGAGIVAVLWLRVLVAIGLAKGLDGAVGALLGLMTYATVLGVFAFQPWGSGSPYNVGERFMLFAVGLMTLVLYPVVVGGVLGLAAKRVRLSRLSRSPTTA